MKQKFQLHAHEVWREKLVREGEYEQSGDFVDVLPQGVWKDSRFVFGRYSARGRDDFAVGNIILRPETGDPQENFFVTGEVHNARKVPLCNLGEIVFSSQKADATVLEMALANNTWGRLFYLDDERKLRREKELRPLNWGLFLAANGFGVWKWTMQDGVTWGKTSPEGLFRWKPSGANHARFLASTSTPVLLTHLENLLEDENSEISFAFRWLQMEEQSGERSDTVSTWTHGSRAEAAEVLRWLLIREMGERKQDRLSLTWHMIHENGRADMIWSDGKSAFSRLRSALASLRVYFGVKANTTKGHPLCVQHTHIEREISIYVDEPTAHERLEAHQQLQTWATQRGLSFD